jgi:hypothetical protein
MNGEGGKGSVYSLFVTCSVVLLNLKPVYNNLKEDVMGRVRSTYESEDHKRFWKENLKGRDH